MQSGTIPRLLGYYLENEQYSVALKRAKEEFFDSVADETLEIDEDGLGLFNEWLVFEFKLSSGHTLLEDFFERNPKSLPMYERQIYKDLQTNQYSLFEILRVDFEQGLKLLNLQTGEEYDVKEVSATRQARVGDLFFGRVGKVGDLFELVGANPIALDSMRLGKGARDFFLNMQGDLNPKVINDLLSVDPAELTKELEIEEGENLSLPQVKKKLDGLLSRMNLKKYVSVELIQRWINKIKWDEDEAVPASILSMLVGLTDGRVDNDEVEELMYLVNAIYNQTPQKTLNNKTPSELSLKRERENKEPELIFTQTQVASNEWYEHYEKARKLMYKNQHSKASLEYNQCFKLLLDDRTTNSEIYRVFANKAMNHLALGEEEEAVRLLEIALEFNPKYDFAQEALKRYTKGEYEDSLTMGRLRQAAKKFKNRKRGRQPAFKTRFSQDPANLYYEFLKKFEINFKTDRLTVSDITSVDTQAGKVTKVKWAAQMPKQKRIGRNELCPCGSGRKFKKCCGG